MNPTPSEAHGILCGLICGGDAHALESWLGQVAPTADAGETLIAEARAALRAWGLAIERDFQTSEPLVQLPSPDESAPLGERALWLYDWVRGFLYALGLLSLSKSDLSAQGREILHDLAAITQIDLDALEDSEENEQALAEVSEFIRVAAMLIHHERAVVRAPTHSGPPIAAGQETDPV
nr:YecA family protein [Allochromatium palmeri]